MKESTLISLIKALGITQETELGCKDCHDELGQYVDMLREGQHPETVKPLIKHHLEMCGNCHEEFDALLQALDQIDA